jgi:signal transduction histidine kinase
MEGPSGSTSRPRSWRKLAGSAQEARPAAERERAGLAGLADLDEELRRLDRLAALGDLLAEIVHEIRNPLVSVKTFLQLLPDRLDEVEFREGFRSVVVDEVQRMERLLDSLVQHARPQRRQQQGRARSAPGPVVESIASLLAVRAMERGLRIEVRAAEELPSAALDEDSLRQVLINLVLNAIEATPPRGAVRLHAEGGAGGVELSVEDEGPGVAPEHRARVFEPFFSTRADRPGGLGLAICRRIAEEAGGRIDVEDAPGGGARFRVWLPGA